MISFNAYLAITGTGAYFAAINFTTLTMKCSVLKITIYAPLAFRAVGAL